MKQLNVLNLVDAISNYEKKFNLALNYSGLRLPQFRIIDFLDKSGKITISDLSRHCNVTRSTISILVTKLIKSGVIKSITNSSDKRSFYIQLTERGKEKLVVARKEISLVEEKISSSINDETIQSLNDFSNLIRNKMSI